MAEFIMKDLVRKAGREDEFYIESAATSTEEIGNHIYPPAQCMLRQKGVWFSPDKTARQMTRSDYDRFDLILCMDRFNLRNILRMLGSDPYGKVSMLLGYKEVADPWYTGDFLEAFNDILEGCEKILDK